jgi:putative ABC transport system permease protein
MQDFRSAIRTATKAPFAPLVVIMGFAVGIGANSAIFSMINAVLLRPLPYVDSGRLVQIRERNEKTGLLHDWVAYPNFLDWREKNQVFEGLAAYRFNLFTLTGHNTPLQLLSAEVSSSLFPVLKAAPAIGRAFTEEEDQKGLNHVVVLSDALWRSEWNADPNVIGTTVRLNENLYTVIGVMPPSFEFPLVLPLNTTLPSKHIDLWVPLGLAPGSAGRGEHFLGVVARLKSGVRLKQAEANMQEIAAALSQQYPDTNRDESVHLNPLLDEVVGTVQYLLLILQAGALFVLLILCGNVANVLLARFSARHKEIAVRLALGATRANLIQLVLAESALYAICGSLVGFLLAAAMIPVLIRVATDRVPRITGATLDAHVLVFSALLGIATIFLAGLIPALRISKRDPQQLLGAEGGRIASERSTTRLRDVLVAFEVALATAVLVGTVLVIETFRNIENVELGFNPRNVLTAWVLVSPGKYPKPSLWTSFYERAMEKLKSLPGVTSAGAVNDLPLSGLRGGGSFDIAGQEVAASSESSPIAERRIVSADYFRTMQIPVLRGRSFTNEDRDGLPCVAMINEAAARRYWPSGDPLGKRISFNQSDQKQPVWRNIVGIVRSIRHDTIESEPRPEIYVPFNQDDCGFASPFMIMVVRANNDPRSLIPAVRRVISSVDPDQALFAARRMEEIYADALAEKRLNVILFSAFGLLALTLSVLGVYSVTAYSVRQRTREIGIRMALGASRNDVLRMVLRKGLAVALIGVGSGVLASIGVSRTLSTLLYGVTAAQAITYIVASCLMLLISLFATCVPAVRAMRVDPSVTLRYY